MAYADVQASEVVPLALAEWEKKRKNQAKPKTRQNLNLSL